MLLVNQLVGFGVSAGCDCVPVYVTGSRSITVTQDIGTPNSGTTADLVDGVTTTSSGIWLSPDSAAVTGKFWKFDFGVGANVKVTGARSVNEQTPNNSKGHFKWQGSNDDSVWEDIGTGASFEWVEPGGGSPTPISGQLVNNTKGYRYYRALGTSGNWRHFFVNEIEFEQCNC